MADNVAVSAGAGTVIAADEVVDGTLGTVKVQYVKLMDGTIDGTTKAGVGANGLKVDGSAVTQPVLGKASDLCVSTTGATGAGVTVTLPNVASQFHYITFIEITKYFTVANAASATPLVVTTTNLPGSLSFTFGQPLGTVGTTDKVSATFNNPLKSSVVNTASTIVCPATAGIIWRVNVFYYTGT